MRINKESFNFDKFNKKITLGTCCEISFIKEIFFEDYTRYPFDWASIFDGKEIIKVLENDFNLQSPN